MKYIKYNYLYLFQKLRKNNDGSLKVLGWQWYLIILTVLTVRIFFSKYFYQHNFTHCSYYTLKWQSILSKSYLFRNDYASNYDIISGRDKVLLLCEI